MHFYARQISSRHQFLFPSCSSLASMLQAMCQCFQCPCIPFYQYHLVHGTKYLFFNVLIDQVQRFGVIQQILTYVYTSLDSRFLYRLFPTSERVPHTVSHQMLAKGTHYSDLHHYKFLAFGGHSINWLIHSMMILGPGFVSTLSGSYFLCQTAIICSSDICVAFYTPLFCFWETCGLSPGLCHCK